MTMSADERRALEELCRVYNIRDSDVEPNREHALVILTALYSNLSIENQHERRRHRDGILRETDRVWGQRNRFFGAIQGHIGHMIVQPGWYGSSSSNAQLSREFRNLAKIVFFMEIIGIGSILGGPRKGVEELIKTGSVRQGIQAAARRIFLGAGSGIIEAASVRAGMALGPWALVAGALLVATYWGMLRRLETIRAEMNLRLTLGRATRQEVDALQNESFVAMLRRQLERLW